MQYNLPINAMPSMVPLDGFVEKSPVVPSDYELEATQLALSVQSHEDYELFKNAIETDWANALNTEKGKLVSSTSRLLSSASMQNLDYADVEYAIAVAKLKADVISGSSYVSLTDRPMMDSSEYTDSDLRYNRNMVTAEAMIKGALSEHDDQSILGTVWDFVDRELVRATVTMGYEGFTNRTERQSKLILNNAVSMDPKEFQDWFTGYIEELKDEGVFTGNNYFALVQGLREVEGRGTNPDEAVDAAFGLLDASGPFGAALKLAKGTKVAAKATKPFKKLAAVEGVEKATEAAETSLKKTGSLETIEELSPSVLDTDVISPSVTKPRAIAGKIAEENKLVDFIADRVRTGVVGRVIDEEVLSKVVAKSVEDFKVRTSLNVVDVKIARNDLFQQPAYVAKIGKVDGSAYATEATAKKAAAKHRDVTVVQDESGGWYLEHREQISTAGLSGELDLSNPYGKGLLAAPKLAIARVIGSAHSVDDLGNNARAMIAESGFSRIIKDVEPYLNNIRSLNVESSDALSRILSDLNSGPEAGMRDWYTDADLHSKFREYLGRNANDKELEAYRSLKTLSDAAYMMKASTIIARYVDGGYKALVINGGRYLAKEAKLADIPDGTPILRGGSYTTSKKLAKGAQVWEYERPINGVKYVTEPDLIDIIDPTDVLGYNAGGSRIYEGGRYFVTVNGGDYARAFMTAFSEQEAKAAVKQIDQLTKLRKEGSLTDDIVRKNNDWNTNIETVDQFENWLKASKIDADNVKFGWKADREAVSELDSGEWKGINSMSMKEAVMVQQSRGDIPLIEYGGQTARTMDPINAVMKQYSSAAYSIANQAAVRRSVDGWVATARKMGLVDPLTRDNFKAFRETKVSGATEAHRRLNDMKSVIERRFNIRSDEVGAFESFGEAMLDYVFDKVPGGKWAARKMQGASPSNALLHLAFASTFGFFNLSQMIVQGAHGLTVIPSLLPKSGMKSLINMPAIRLMVNTGSEEARELAARRLAKSPHAGGLTAEDFMDLGRYYDNMGADVLGAELLEHGTGVSMGFSGWRGHKMVPSQVDEALRGIHKASSKLYDASFVAYRSGEKFSRYAQINAAFYEFKRLFPEGSVMSDQGQLWMANKIHELGFHMTNAGKSSWQQGLARIPMQWLSYGFRSLEAVALGREFTKAERARLLVPLAFLWGFDSAGMGSVADWMGDKMGLEGDDFSYRALKYGPLDALFKEATGYDSNFGGRVSPLRGIIDMVSNWSEQGAVETLGGPSASIVYEGGKAVVNAVVDLMSGRTTHTTEDLWKAARSIRTFDNLNKAYGIYHYGIIINKNGGVVQQATGRFDYKDAIMQATGFSPLEVEEFYSRQFDMVNHSKKLGEFRKEINADMDKAFRYLDDGDEETFISLVNEIGAKIKVSGFNEAEQWKLSQGLWKGRENKTTKIILDLMKRDADAATRFAATMTGEE